MVRSVIPRVVAWVCAVALVLGVGLLTLGDSGRSLEGRDTSSPPVEPGFDVAPTTPARPSLHLDRGQRARNDRPGVPLATQPVASVLLLTSVVGLLVVRVASAPGPLSFDRRVPVRAPPRPVLH